LREEVATLEQCAMHVWLLDISEQQKQKLILREHCLKPLKIAFLDLMQPITQRNVVAERRLAAGQIQGL